MSEKLDSRDPLLFNSDSEFAMDGSVIPGTQTHYTYVRLRDFFAGLAMQQIMTERHGVAITAAAAYGTADAMLAERNKR